MKKILCTLLLVIMFIPNMVVAKEKINVYMFYGDGCPHCHSAMEFFDSIEDEYGKYYNLVTYETWYSHNNSKLMTSAADAMKTDTTKLGVPYIIIGDQTFLGYSASYNEDIKKAIVDTYNDEDYTDNVKPIIDKMKKGTLNTILIAGATCIGLIIMVIINFALRKKYNKQIVA